MKNLFCVPVCLPVWAATMIAACGPSSGHDVLDPDPVDGAFDQLSQALLPSAAEETAVLSLVNRASFEVLDVDAKLNARAVRNIMRHRQGADRTDRTADDDLFDTIDELDAISYVGPVALRTLLRYARNQGLVNHPSPGMDDRAVLHVANNASLVALDDAVSLDVRAARAIVAHRRGVDGTDCTADDDRFDSIAELDAVSWVGRRAFGKLRAHVTAQGLANDAAALARSSCDAPPPPARCAGYELLGGCYSITDEVLPDTASLVADGRRDAVGTDASGTLYLAYGGSNHPTPRVREYSNQSGDWSWSDRTKPHSSLSPLRYLPRAGNVRDLFYKRNCSGNWCRDSHWVEETHLCPSLDGSTKAIDAAYAPDGKLWVVAHTRRPLHSSTQSQLVICHQDGGWIREVVRARWQGAFCAAVNSLALGFDSAGQVEIYANCRGSVDRYRRGLNLWEKETLHSVGQNRTNKGLFVLSEFTRRHVFVGTAVSGALRMDYLEVGDRAVVRTETLATGIPDGHISQALLGYDGTPHALVTKWYGRAPATLFRVDAADSASFEIDVDPQGSGPTYTDAAVGLGAGGEIYMSRIDRLNGRTMLRSFVPLP